MDTITLITKDILRGVYDSIKGITVVWYLDRELNRKQEIQKMSAEYQMKTNQKLAKKDEIDVRGLEPSNVMKRVINCCVLNGGIFWLSIIFFEQAMMPLIYFVLNILFGKQSGTGTLIWSWMQPVLSILFNMIWVLPLFLLSRIVNSLWFQDIADSAYKFRKGRAQSFPSFSKSVADFIFSLVVQILFLVQSMVVRQFPIDYVGSFLCFGHICLLYSLYSFEYKWCNMGWELHKRLTYIENNWPYFFGFGIPLAILTQIPESYFVSGCVFAIGFPLFILSGNESTPPSRTESNFQPMRLFSPVVAISNSLFSKTPTKKLSSQQTKQQQQSSMTTPKLTNQVPSTYESTSQMYNKNMNKYVSSSNRSSNQSQRSNR